jgi:beta-N-acetylhexosaminidase
MNQPSSRRRNKSQVSLWIKILAGVFSAGILFNILCILLYLFIPGIFDQVLGKPAAIVGIPSIETPSPPALISTAAGATPYPAILILSTETITKTFTPEPLPTLKPTQNAELLAVIAGMSLEQKIGQLIMAGVDGQEISSFTCSQIGQVQPGAIIYRASNVYSVEQVKRLSNALQECSFLNGGVPLFIALDHEGQYVTRFQTGSTIFPAALAFGAAGLPDLTNQAARAAGQEQAYSGVNVVLGPVADVLTNPDNSVISQRSFGDDPQAVSLQVEAAVRGYLDGGVLPVLKHFPGHGGVAGDSHQVLPVDDAGLDVLGAVYLPPFKRGIAAGAEMVMTSHVAFTQLDASLRPATISSNTIQILRDELGFEGVTVSDSMEMGAVTSGSGLTVTEACVQAVKAGVDLLLVPSPTNVRAVQSRLVQAVNNGELESTRVDEAVYRILMLKKEHGLSQYPLTGGVAPDWSNNQLLAFGVGYKAVTLDRNQEGIVPLPVGWKRILVIGPTDGWGLYPILVGALEERGYQVELEIYTSPWFGVIPETGMLDTLPRKAQGYDGVIFLTWNAHINRLVYRDTWQTTLANLLDAAGPPLVLVALKSPTDILEYPQAMTFMATFGTKEGQIQALADILTGKVQASGTMPLIHLP